MHTHANRTHTYKKYTQTQTAYAQHHNHILCSQVYVVLRCIECNTELKYNHHSHADGHWYDQLDDLLCTVPQGTLKKTKPFRETD